MSICYLFTCKYNISGECIKGLGEPGAFVAKPELMRYVMERQRNKKPHKKCYERDIEDADYTVEE